jgi:hypothetical protein
MAGAASPSSHSSFCEEVFSVVAGTVDPGAAITDRGDSRMRWTGQIFWLLAFGPALDGRAFFPPSPPKKFRGLAQWEVVSSYSSATAPGSHGISCADPLDQTRKELIQQYRLALPRSRFISPFRYETAAERQNHAPGNKSSLLFR